MIGIQAQDPSAYISTNLISIADDQAYRSPEPFQTGILSAVDVGKSASRVGGRAQLRAYRAVAGARRGRIYIGTSGWHYAHWVGRFYPDGMASNDFLSYYVRRFRTVEINNTFYRLPAPRTLAQWRDATPARFVFACKASRFITHMKKLKDPAQSTARFFDRIEVLGGKLGPVLFQLPPRWGVDVGRLRAFLAALPGGRRFAFEFRDESWFTAEVYQALADRNAAFCPYDLGGRRAPIEVTADFVYVRLHGPDGPYRGRYDGRTLSGWRRRLAAWRDSGRDVYVYFDNDENAYAAEDAARLRDMVERERELR